MPSATAPDWRLKLDGTEYTLPRAGFRLLELQAYTREGDAELSFMVRGSVIPERPDPFLGVVTLEYDVGSGWVQCFTGRCESAPFAGSPYPWSKTYTARGLSFSGDLLPITNTNTGDDTFVFNADPDDYLTYRADLAGRTVGEMIEAVLSDTTIDADLTEQGITSFSTTDLDDITHIPPYPCTIAGERCIGAIAGFLRQHAPNHCLWISPAGVIRFLDLRKYGDGSSADYPSAYTLEMGTDKVDVAGVSLVPSTEGCFSRVVVRGASYAEMRDYKLSDGSLEEDFAYDALDNEDAKDAWALADWNGAAATQRDVGSCTTPDTTHVTVTSDDAALSWAANFWDQTSTGRKGIIYLTYTAGSGITFKASRKITANASLSPAGTSSITLERALPHTNFNAYEIRGIGSKSSLVWRKYQVEDDDCAERLRPRATFPAPVINANSNIATMSSTPVFEIAWSSDGNPPYATQTMSATIDYSTGSVIFDQPTVYPFGTDANLELGNGDTDGIPTDVIAWIPTQTDELYVACPEDTGTAYAPAYDGTLSTIEGINRTLTVTAPFWRDPANESNMQDYACYLHDSVKDTVIEGTIPLLYFDKNYLTPGRAVKLGGNGYDTEWEDYVLPVVGCKLRWGNGEHVPYRMELQISTRRSAFGANQFQRPMREGEFEGLGGATLNIPMFSSGYNAAPNMDVPSMGVPSAGTPSADTPRMDVPFL